MDMSSYDEILLGFPIWWYVAPTIVNTFLEAYDFSGKKIVLFATSGGSGFGNTVKELQLSAPPEIYHEEAFKKDGFVQPYGDSPLDGETVGEHVYLNIISQAKKYLYIFTPYLIPDNETLTALCMAAKRGVDVRIVTPGIPDKKIVYILTQANYEILLESGVQIYQYTPGFIHSKSFVCDDEVATVGTINMDYRSMYLHFECGVWMYGSSAVAQVKEDALITFEQCEQINMDYCRKKNFAVRALRGALKFLAPLL